MSVRALSRLALLTGLAVVPLGSAQAQDLAIYGGAALQYYTKNDDGPSKSDLNGYVELEYGGLYGGVWVELSDWDDATEVDYYIGYRGEVAQLSYDVNYYYYAYPEVDPNADYGELGLVLDYALTDSFSIGTEIYHQPDLTGHSAYLTAAYAPNDKLSFDLSWGRYYYESGGQGYNEWEAGVGYMIGEETGLELRYYNGQEYDDYVRLQLSWDTTLLGG